MSDNNEHINDFDQSFKNRFEQEGINPPDNAWNDLEAQFGQMDNEAFDAAIKDKFNAGINPPEMLWQNIDKETQEKSRNFRGVYWILLGCVFGISLAYLLVETFDSKIDIAESTISYKPVQETIKGSNETNLNEHSTKEVVKKPENHKQTTKENSLASKNTNLTDLSINKSLIDETDSNDVPKETKNPKINTSLVTQDTLDNIVVNQPRKLKNNSVKSTNPIAIKKPITNKDSNTKPESNNNHPLISTTPNRGNEKNTPGWLNTNSKPKLDKDSPTTDFSNIEKTNDNNIEPSDTRLDSNLVSSVPFKLSMDSLISSIDSAKTINIPIPDSAIISSADTLLDSNRVVTSDTSQVKSEDKTEKKKLNNDSTKKWMVTAYVVPEFQYQRVRKNGSKNHFFDSLLTSNFSQLFEIGASYTIKKQFQIGIGFSVNMYSHHYTKSVNGINRTIPINATYPSGVLEVNGLFGNTKTPDLIEIQMAPNGADLNEFLINKEILYDEKLDYTIVNIPFDVKWVPGNYRVKPVIKLGGEFNIITKSSSEVSLTFLQETTTADNHAEIRGINFSGSLGLGTQIDLIKGLGITLLPGLNYQSSGISNNSEFKFTPYSIRLYSGLYYKF